MPDDIDGFVRNGSNPIASPANVQTPAHEHPAAKGMMHSTGAGASRAADDHGGAMVKYQERHCRVNRIRRMDRSDLGHLTPAGQPFEWRDRSRFAAR